MIHPCDRQTDGRAIAYTRYSIYAVARKKWTDLPQNKTNMIIGPFYTYRQIHFKIIESLLYWQWLT